MAKECFEDDEVARLLNQHFISIKLDRDERPDIDRRYQNAVSAMGFGGGWPLSVFLTPEKKPFFGGTYFPPEDSQGRPGFRKVLKSVADFYASKREHVIEYSRTLSDALRQNPFMKGEIQEASIHNTVSVRYHKRWVWICSEISDARCCPVAVKQILPATDAFLWVCDYQDA
jgi:uncharacterized protein